MSDWRDVVLMSDASVTTIAVVEAGDDLVDSDGAVEFTGESPVARLVRRPVLDRLLTAAEALPGDLRLALNEGYRPPALQRFYFDRYAARLAAAHPDADAAEVHRLASRFVSPPEVAPHTAGAAVDVVLATPAARCSTWAAPSTPARRPARGAATPTTPTSPARHSRCAASWYGR